MIVSIQNNDIEIIDRIQIEDIEMKLDNFKHSKENETKLLGTDGNTCSLKL